jgi:hypothetical protein
MRENKRHRTRIVILVAPLPAKWVNAKTQLLLRTPSCERSWLDAVVTVIVSRCTDDMWKILLNAEKGARNKTT